MKRGKKILTSWIVACVVVALAVAVVLYENAGRGQAVVKEVAIQTLREVAERVVNRKFDELGIGYMMHRPDGDDKKAAKRKAVSEEGEFEVTVDSLKEAQALFPLYVIRVKSDILHCYGKFPLEEVCMEWKADMDDRYSGTQCALSLKVSPLGKGGVHETSAGDGTIIASRNDAGTYYLDGMYTMRLTAYVLVGFWGCVDWADHTLQALVCILCFLLLGLVAYIGMLLYEKRKESDGFAKTTCRFGKYVFDLVNHTLAYEGENISCKSQAAKLLLGFAKSPDFSLTNDEIAEICDWNLSDSNLDERRRKAMSLLNKLFRSDDSVRIIPLPEGNGYHIVISSCG